MTVITNLNAEFTIPNVDPAATGEFSAQRFQDTTGKEVTLVTYSFCVVTTATQCEEGNGTVLDSDFLGKITAEPEGATTFTADHLTLTVDTTAAGFTNTMCIAPNDQQQTCAGGTEVATGVLMAFVIDKTGVGTTDVNTDGSGTVYSAPSQYLGTILGNSVNNISPPGFQIPPSMLSLANLNGGLDVWLPQATVPIAWAKLHPAAAAKQRVLIRTLLLGHQASDSEGVKRAKK